MRHDATLAPCALDHLHGAQHACRCADLQLRLADTRQPAGCRYDACLTFAHLAANVLAECDDAVATFAQRLPANGADVWPTARCQHLLCQVAQRGGCVRARDKWRQLLHILRAHFCGQLCSDEVVHIVRHHAAQV